MIESEELPNIGRLEYYSPKDDLFQAKLPPDGFLEVVLNVWGGLSSGLQDHLSELGEGGIMQRVDDKRKKRMIALSDFNE